MKGTLLLLALLVIGELGFQTTEACFAFFEVYFRLVSGERQCFLQLLTVFDGIEEEIEAFYKIQDCYNEEGLKVKHADLKTMKATFSSQECLKYYGEDCIKKFKARFLYLS